MAGIQTILSSATTETSKAEFLFLLVRIHRNPYTKALIPEVEAFRPKIDVACLEEQGHIEAEASANAAVQFADQDCDTSVDFVGDNVDRKSMLGARLFGDMRPSQLKRPTLAGQLQVMSDWPDALAQSGKPVLEAHAPVVADRVKAGLAAAQEKQAASAKLADFRAVGTRVKLNEEHNALRKSLYGKLGEIQHANNLPSGWAESFFRQETSESLTVAELDRKIGATEGELEALKKQREALKAEEAKIAAVRAEAIRKEKKAKLEALAKARAELEAKEKALQAELGENEGTP